MTPSPAWLQLRSIRPSGLNASETAGWLHKTIGLTGMVPVPTGKVIQGLGIKIEQLSTGTHVAGEAEFEIGESPRAIVRFNPGGSMARQRFTLAHELGHVLLHTPGRLYRDDVRAEYSAIEREANEFAAAYLMPEQELRKLFEPAVHDTRALAEKFMVSRSALAQRLLELRLVHL